MCDYVVARFGSIFFPFSVVVCCHNALYRVFDHYLLLAYEVWITKKYHPIKKKGENIFKFCSSWPRTLELVSYVWKFDKISLKWFHINLVLGLIKVYLSIIVNILLANRNRKLLLTTLYLRLATLMHAIDKFSQNYSILV